MALDISGSLLVVSPHLDDAVFSCAALLARHPGATVATVFAGIPEGFDALTEWDAASDFDGAAEGMRRRREEDRHALAVLGATPRWLDFLDSQYRDTPSRAALAAALREVVDELRPAAVLLPAGLFHSDHLLVHDAMLDVRRALGGIDWLLYEEALYRPIPGLLQRRLAALAATGIRAAPIAGEPLSLAKSVAKCEAVACYASQLQALARTVKAGCGDIFQPERYWRLDGMPAGEDDR
ncbi:MAG: PIG-L deacetylase family protein [Burkholderiaceae bacterium]